jgi:hypothetical protein
MEATMDVPPFASGSTAHVPHQQSIPRLLVRVTLTLVLLRLVFLVMIVLPAYTSGLATLAQYGIDVKGVDVWVPGYAENTVLGDVTRLIGMLLSGVVIKIAPLISLLVVLGMGWTRRQWLWQRWIGWLGLLLASWGVVIATAPAATAFVRWLWD